MHRTAIGPEGDRAFAENRDQIAQPGASDEVDRLDGAVKLAHHGVGDGGILGTANQYREERGTAVERPRQIANHGRHRLRKIDAARPRRSEEDGDYGTSREGDRRARTLILLGRQR